MGFYTGKKWGDVYGDPVRTPVGRLVFLNLDQPNVFNEGKPKFSATLLFPKTDLAAWKTLTNKFYAQVNAMVAQAFPGHNLENAPIQKSWILDGDEPAPRSGKIYASHTGHWALKGDADVAKKPSVIDNQGKLIDPATLLPGMKARFVVTPQVYQGFGGGVSYKLMQVMLVEDDGVRLYGGPDPKSIMFAEDDDTVFNENQGYGAPQVQVPAQQFVQAQQYVEPVPQQQAPQYVAPQQQTFQAPVAPQAPAAPKPPRGRPAKAVQVPPQAQQAAAVAMQPQTAPNPAPGNGPAPAVRSPGGVPQGPIPGGFQPAAPQQMFTAPPMPGGPVARPNGPAAQPMPQSVAGSMPAFKGPQGPVGALKLV